MNVRRVSDGVWSFAARIHAHTEWRVFLLELTAVAYSFTAAAFGSRLEALSTEPWAVIRLLIPTGVVGAVLLIRNGSAPPDGRSHLASTVDVGLAAAATFVIEELLAIVSPNLALTRWAPTQGGLAGWLFLSAMRALFPPADNGKKIDVVLDEVRWRAEEFERVVSRRTRIGYIAGTVAVVMSGVGVLHATASQRRIGFCLLLAGATYLLVLLHQSRLSVKRSVEILDWYRRELERLTRMLNLLWFGFFGSLLPAAFLLLAGSRVYEYFILLYILLLAEVNLRTIGKLRREALELDRAGASNTSLSGIAYDS